MTVSSIDDQSYPQNAVTRLTGIVLSIAAFSLTFAFFTHFILFLGNLPATTESWVMPTVDIGDTFSPGWAAAIDLGLVALFGLQHSLMARPHFKAWCARTIPEGLERTVYVLAAILAGFIMLLFWQPIPITLWDAPDAIASIFWSLFVAGWLLLLLSAISFDIFELLGIRQALAWVRDKPLPAAEFKASGTYRLMSHPMYLGVLLGLWMIPHMTAGHALMATAFTVYIMVARRYEERDLSEKFDVKFGEFGEEEGVCWE